MEVLYGHDSDCIIDDGEHVDDWECIAELVNQGYVDYMMPMILEEYQIVDNCVDGLPTVLARYNEELCVVPCIALREDGFWVCTLRSCGDAEACCIKRTYYCVDSDGVITIPLEYRVQDGECSQDAFSPCPMMGTCKGETLLLP